MSVFTTLFNRILLMSNSVCAILFPYFAANVIAMIIIELECSFYALQGRVEQLAARNTK